MTTKNYNKIELTLADEAVEIPNSKFTERLFRHMTVDDIIRKDLWGTENYPIYRINIKSTNKIKMKAKTGNFCIPSLNRRFIK